MKSGGSALSVRRWWRSARFAWQGVRDTWRAQANFRIEVTCAALVIPVAAWVGAPLAPVLLACALVLSLELINTALEAVVDLASPDIHPLARVAKDAAAASVLLASLGALGVGVVEVLPRLLQHLLG
ncbi:diacylglycerol kinase [Deinococcus maricopensis]|uniref:Diacylglycerol kinase n=1 Tax=Deinococcus maricopensis (strain DSM 21211 / LMG 22137 / NRRL B-23946 / LB-34) TaxID=709986 RepID=E8UA99_DEIML|nr:diacylglycerol kinase [Deinococcus maricopensis]ADV67988.1 diacylglycerol kinase [Deinococcus maricopensis DSM 21211]